MKRLLLNKTIFALLSLILSAQGLSGQITFEPIQPQQDAIETKGTLFEQRQKLNHQISPMINERRQMPANRAPMRGGILKASTGAKFRGNLMSDSGWPNYKPEYGLYDLDGTTCEISTYFLDDQGLMHSDYGGALIGDYYYLMVDYNIAGLANYYVKYVFNVATLKWEGEKSELVPNQDITYLAWSNTPYDEETGLCYGYFYNSTGNSVELCSMDYPTLTRQFIAYPEHLFCVLAIDNSDGQLYGIDSDGLLYKIDKSNGEESLIGDTGMEPSNYHQAAAIDPKFHKMYWTYITKSNDCGLAEIDLSDAFTFNSDFDRLIQFGDIYLVSQGVSESAPDVVENVRWAPNTDDFNLIDLCFDMPTKSNDGNTNLGNDLEYVVYSGDDILRSEKASPGAHVSITLSEIPLQQSVQLGIVARNGSGESAVSTVSVWAGKDIPSPVPNATLTISETGKAKLTWEASSGGTHGGYVEPLSVSYNVTRYPGGVLACNTTETEFEEDVDISQLAYYYYSVEAISDNPGIASAPTLSNKVKVGEYLIPPYDNYFNDINTIENFWSSLDFNKDGYAWEWDENFNVMRIILSYSGNSDWLISPPFYLEKDHVYTIEFDAETSLGGMLELSYGSNDIPKTWEILLNVGKVSQSSTTYKVTLQPSKSNVYRFGIREYSSYGIETDVSRFSISPGAHINAPAEVSDLTASALDKGQKVQLDCVLPTTTVSGDDLPMIDEVSIYRDGNKIATLTDGLQPGEPISFTDENIPTEGEHRYGVAAHNKAGEGKRATVISYSGIDSPNPPVLEKMIDNGDGTITMEWDNPSVGQHGGYVDTDKLSNNIYTIRNNSLEDMIATIKGDSYTSTAYLEGEPGWFYLGLTAIDATERESSPTLARLIKGTPAPLPLVESFAGRTIHESRFWWGTPLAGSTNWGLVSRSCDDDGGSMSFTCSAKGDEALLGTRKITLNGTVKPTMELSLYNSAGSNSSLLIEIDRSQNGEIETVAQYDFGQQNPDGGWQEASIDLTPFIDDPYIIVRFHAVGNTEGDIVGFDAISIRDLIDRNLAINLDVPSTMFTGNFADIIMEISNESNETSGTYQYKLTATYDFEGATQTVELISGEDEGLQKYGGKKTYEVNFKATPFILGNVSFTATVEYEGDALLDNNTAQAVTNVSSNITPIITDLTATNSEGKTNATLSWTEPTGEAIIAKRVTDDFESYRSWTLNWGEWETYDADGGLSGGIFNGVSYPYEGRPFAYILFNPNELVSNATQQVPQLKPRSGDQFACSIYAVSPDNEVIDQDNWLISPELPGIAQTITFYAKSMSTYFPIEKFEVLYSTSDTNIENFVKIGDTHIVNDPDNWALISVDLPEGAKYFAIRDVTDKDNTFMLMIDDASFTKIEVGDLEITGYNIYIDGELYSTVSKDDRPYTAGPLTDGEHAIYVTVLYGEEKIESALSNKASVVTAINELSVTDIEGLDIIVYTPSGIKVAEGINAAANVRQGVYLIKIKSTGQVKTIVRK